MALSVFALRLRTLKTRVKILLVSMCWALGIALVFAPHVRAEIFFEPTIGASAGKFQDLSYTEMRLGAIFSMQDQFLRFEATGFHRYVDGGDNFSGADFALQVQRWFQVTQRFLLGTRLGPGYRWASNDSDAPYLDFSLSFKQLDLFGLRIGYKLLFHEMRNKDYENENMIYISFEI